MRKTLFEMFPNWKETNNNTNIFNALLNEKAEGTLPWLTDATVNNYNINYFGVHSGLKTASGFVHYIRTGDELTAEEVATIAKAILTRYANKWERLYKVAVAEYDMLIDTITDTLEHGKTETKTPGVTDTRTVKTGTEVVNETDDNNTNEAWGFNSTGPYPRDASTGKTTLTTKADKDKNETIDTLEHEGQDVTQNTGSDVHTIKKSAFDNAQTALQEELKLWNNYSFISILFMDIDNILTMGVY